MHAIDAISRACRHYPGGIPAIATRLGKSTSTLEKELRCAPGFKLGAEDALAISAMCADLGTPHALDYANAVAEVVRAELNLIPHLADADADTVKDVSDVMRECADVVQAVVGADADRVVTANELREAESQASELIAAVQTTLSHLRAKHEAAKPAHLRRGAKLGGKGGVL